MTLRRILAAIGLGSLSVTSAVAHPPYAPYTGAAANDIYNLLFCDAPDVLRPRPGQPAAAWQAILHSNPPKVPALLSLGDDSAQDGRIRYVAYASLRALGQTVPAKRLLGVIVEVSLSAGVDTLAAYSEGGVRYINHSGQMGFFEGVPSLQPHVKALFAASTPAVGRIGPWLGARRAPPKPGRVRLTFLVSDGLYFGEGQMSKMEQDALAGPILQQATKLLQLVVTLPRK